MLTFLYPRHFYFFSIAAVVLLSRSEKELDKLRMEFLSDEARHTRRYASVEKTKGHNSPYTK